MWLFTKMGFYSIVEDKREMGKWQVRARAKKDLQNLIAATDYRGKLIRTPKADYLYRIVVDAAQLVSIMMCLTKQITYPNFKDAVKAVPNQKDKIGILSVVWGDMWEYQHRLEPSRTSVKTRKHL